MDDAPNLRDALAALAGIVLSWVAWWIKKRIKKNGSGTGRPFLNG